MGASGKSAGRPIQHCAQPSAKRSVARRRNSRSVFGHVLVYAARVGEHNNPGRGLEYILEQRATHALTDADRASVHAQTCEPKPKFRAHVPILQTQPLDIVCVRRVIQLIVGRRLVKSKYQIS